LVQAGTAGFAQSASFAKVLSVVPGGAAILQNPMLLEAAKMAMMNGTGAAAGALMDQENWRNGTVLQSMLTKGAAGMASGAVTGGLMGAAGGVSSNRMVAGVLGGAMGGLAQTALDPAAWDGDYKKALIQNLGTNVGGALIAGMAGGHGANAPKETVVEPTVAPGATPKPAIEPGAAPKPAIEPGAA